MRMYDCLSFRIKMIISGVQLSPCYICICLFRISTFGWEVGYRRSMLTYDCFNDRLPPQDCILQYSFVWLKVPKSYFVELSIQIFQGPNVFKKDYYNIRNFQLNGVPSPDACLRLSPKLPRLGYLVLDSHYFLNCKFQIWYILPDELNFMPSKILFHNYCNRFLSWFFWPQVQIFLQIIPITSV